MRKKILLTVGFAVLIAVAVYFIVDSFQIMSQHKDNLSVLERVDAVEATISFYKQEIARLTRWIVFLIFNIMLYFIILLNVWFDFVTIKNKARVEMEEYKKAKEEKLKIKTEKKKKKLEEKLKNL